MTRMFTDPATGTAMKTWNVFVGCKYDCTYCNAKVLARTRLKHNLRYRDGFEKPHLVPELLTRGFNPGDLVFICYMGDISFATRYELWQILRRVECYLGTDFLLISKNPAYFLRWPDPLPQNTIVGTTLETNRNHGLSKAPAPLKRWIDLQALKHPRKFLSIEPVMDFDPRELTRWIGLLGPTIIEVGADNYHHNLPEPSWEKVEQLLEFCRSTGAQVVEKPGLERLRGT